MDLDLLTPFSAFMSQIGGRQLQFNLTDAQKKLMAHPVTQMAIMFAMFYITTRSVWIAFALLLVYYVCLYVLLNENHPWNVLSPKWLAQEGFTQAAEKSSRDLYYENLARLV